jgi:hypothetical protein
MCGLGVFPDNFAKIEELIETLRDLITAISVAIR